MRKVQFGNLDAWLAGGTDREGGGSGPALVLLHGFGAPATDLVPLWRQIETSHELRFVFLGAPLVLEPGLPDDEAARAWWMIDIAELQQKAAAGRVDELMERVPEGLSEARSALGGALDAIERELALPSSRIVLGGFSQGSMVACDFALRDARPLGGLVLLSSTLIARSEWLRLAPGRAGLPVLQSHGRADPILPFELAEKAHELLSGAGLDVEFIAFNSGHGIPGGVLDALGRFFDPHSRTSVVKLAAIDIGTNSIHIVIVEATGRGGFEVIDRQKRMVKLGAGLWTTHRISDRAVSDGLEVVRRYYKLAESRGVDEILAVATSASREAENGSEFLEAIFRETGLTPRVISGMEEARLIFLAARHAVDIGTTRSCVIDIGGGSVEVAVGDAESVLLSQSLRLGVQRLLDRVGNTGPISERQMYELRGFIQGAAGEVMQHAGALGFARLIGTSGTIRAIGEAAHLGAGGTSVRTLNATSCKRRDIKDLVRKLCEMDEVRRAKVPGISEGRADTVHLGAALLLELMELCGAEEITLCDGSLREGVILDYLERHGTTSPLHPPIVDPRRRSVIELMRKYDRDDPREHHVAALSMALFDHTKPLHALGPAEREMLDYAALLHGIGRHLNYVDREAHSSYIIRHSALRGFTPAEVELLSLIVRYHRGARPRKRHGRLLKFDRFGRHVLSVLSGILRLAVALDRGHCQLVQHVEAEVDGHRVRLELGGPGELELELWAARGKVKPLEKALRARIDVERAPS